MQTLFPQDMEADVNVRDRLSKLKNELQKDKDNMLSKLKNALQKEKDKIKYSLDVIETCIDSIDGILKNDETESAKMIGCMNALLTPVQGKVPNERLSDIVGKERWAKLKKPVTVSMCDQLLSEKGMHYWKSGDLEELICKVLLEANAIDTLISIFNVRQSAHAGKKGLIYITEAKLMDLVSNYLLQCDDVKEFLNFILDHEKKDFHFVDESECQQTLRGA